MPEGLAQKIRASGVIEGERKQVTVVFCDLVGSTAIAERLDPEEYHDLLEQYLEIAFREIYRFEGIVNQLAGDGLMALFGAPIAHEDAPERAVRAALAIHVALKQYNATLQARRGFALRARFGINTGPVVVGTVGNDLKMDYTAVGDTTNLAARLEALAPPDGIMLSDATYRLVRGIFEVREAGPFAVKGKSEPVEAYEVLGLSEDTTPMAIAAERGLSPFVGRHDELAQLETCFQRLTGTLAQVVAVVGEAGIGKSRLLYEFRLRIAEQSQVVFEARCAPLNQLVPHSLWVNMLRHYFRLGADDAAAVAAEKVANKLRQWDPELRELYPYICHILGLPADICAQISPEDLKRATFESVSRLIVHESHTAPVLIVIEDLHWIDEPSREVLDRAVAEMGAGRIMLIVSHRPDYQQSWRTAAALTQLNLRHLSDDEATQIIHHLAGAPLPTELTRLILSKAEGSPFFIEEITRGILEGGYVARENGHHRLTRPLEEIRIPGTVREVIAARLDRLPADAKRVLQVAAVFGRQFSREQLAQLLGADGIDVVRALREIERRGIIHRKNLFSTDEYRFGESLTQEVAYEGLLLKQRRQLHERIGALLDASSGETTPERSALLAHHYARSDNREKAVSSLLRAARDAERVPSWRTAARFYRAAWDLLEPELTPGDEPLHRLAIAAAVGLGRMVVIYNAPDTGNAEHVAQRALLLARQVGDAAAESGLHVYQGMMMMADRTRFAEGVTRVEEGLAVAQRAGVALPAMSRGLAWAYLYDGRFDVARRTIDWAVGEFESTEDAAHPSDLHLGARYMRARVHFVTDDLDGAVQEAARTYEQAVRAANRTVQSGTAGTVAHVHFLRGNYAEARRWADRSLEMAQVVGNASAIVAESSIAWAAAHELGDPTASGHYLALLGNDIASEGELSLNAHLISDALVTVGEVARAERYARLAYNRASGRLREMLSALALADALTAREPTHWEEAERCYEQAVGLAEALGARAILAASRLGIARLAAARADREACARHLQQVLPICEALHLARYQTRAEHLIGGLHGGRLDAAAAPRPLPENG